MSVLINIILDIILPIFVLIAVGFIAQKKLQMDVRTFTKINIYIFIPAIIFTKIYSTEVTWQLFATVLFYLLSIMLIMLVLGMVVAHVLSYPRGIRNAFLNSLLFFNAGNYGLPIAELAFQHNPLAASVQIFIMVIQNILGSTLGVFQATTGKKSKKEALKNVLIMPSLYVLMAVVIIKSFQIVVPEVILFPLNSMAKGFVPIALITLGVQLAEVKISTRIKDIFVACSLRLILGPTVGFILVALMGLEGILAKSLIIGVATPAAVNTAIIAKEFDNEPEYASQIVFFSTIFSIATISVLIYALQYLSM